MLLLLLLLLRELRDLSVRDEDEEGFDDMRRQLKKPATDSAILSSSSNNQQQIPNKLLESFSSQKEHSLTYSSALVTADGAWHHTSHIFY